MSNELENYLRPGEGISTVKQDTLRKRRDRAAQRVEREQANRTWDSTVELDEHEIRDVLTEHGYGGISVRHPRVRTILPWLIDTAATNLHTPATEYLITHGPSATLKSRAEKKEQPLPQVQDAYYPGSRLRRFEEHALYDVAESWRPHADTFDPEIHTEEERAPWSSFEEWLEWRRIAITDVFTFAKFILGGADLDENLHGRWANELFVVKDPSLLKEHYAWSDVRTALMNLSPIKQRLLISARATFKSWYNRADLVSWIVYFGGDIRIRMITATKTLSDGFLKALRDVFVVKDVNHPSLFQRLYPEFVLYPKDEQGSAKSFTSPMRRLSLIEPTVLPSSLDTEGQSGSRSDLQIYEDVVDISNSSTPDMREKVVEKTDMLRRLNEPGFGFVTFVGTPFASGDGTEADPGDLYAVLLQREARATQKRLLYQNHPIWRMKPGVKKKPYDTSLTPDEVEITQPARFTFDDIMAQLREAQKVARQQLLCEWVQDDDSQIKIHFDPNLLTRSVIHSSIVPPGDTYLGVDIAYSMSARADMSSIAVVRVHQTQSGLKGAVVLDVEADRSRGSELAHRIVMMCRIHNPRMVFIERGPTHENLQHQISMTAAKYGVSVPVHFVTPSNAKGAKFSRIKDLELLLDAGRLKFKSSDYIDALFAELQKIDGKPSSAGKKDDMADSISIVTNSLRIIAAVEEDTQRSQPEDEALHREANMKANYAAVFGSGEPRQPMQAVLPPAMASSGSKFAAYQKARSQTLKNR